MSDATKIIRAALEARTLEDAEDVQRLIEADIGERHERPLGDKWNNFGLMTSPGSFDHKVLEPVTNMQDAVLERLALAKFHNKSSVPYANPHDAAADLLKGRGYQEIADHLTVTFHEAEPPVASTKRMTIAYRDHGCGMTPSSVPNTIFFLGSSHKTECMWQQGAFGLGGARTYRNAQAIVIVTRRAPELNTGDDLITVAVVTWRTEGKGRSATYLTTTKYESGQNAEPWSAPAVECPEFEPGTYLALVSYGVEGFHRARLGDEKSFDTVLNTRLFQPIMPVRFTNLMRAERKDYLRGLFQRLEDNPRPDRQEGVDKLPYHIGGTTYQLPVRFYVFAKPGEPGARRKFVAYDHAVMFTSNGQVHHHWTPQEFRYKTQLNKLYDRILIVIETDELPIEVRTQLFTPDRSGFLLSDDALRLEASIAGFLDAWGELRDINNALIREAITRSSSPESTIEIARQISKALEARGFSLPGRGTSGGGGKRGLGGIRKPIDLYNDPTMLEGPEKVMVLGDTTKFIQYKLNAVDDFLPNRGQLQVSCDHPEINAREITVGELHDGRVRVSIAVPPDAEVGIFELVAEIDGWQRLAGGLGAMLKCTTEFEVLDELPEQKAGTRKNKGKGATKGPLVAVIWTTPADQTNWNNGNPGSVEAVPASALAERPEYAMLAKLGDDPIPTILLNEEYGPFKTFVGVRSRDLTEGGVEGLKQRYAVGTGLGLLYLNRQFGKRRKAGQAIDEAIELEAQQAVSRSVLAVMPEFDRLVKEAGITE